MSEKLFSSFNMAKMKILQVPDHLPVLELAGQVMDLTSAVVDLTSTVARIDEEAREAKDQMEAEIAELKRRLLLLEHRDQSPKRV